MREITDSGWEATNHPCVCRLLMLHEYPKSDKHENYVANYIKTEISTLVSLRLPDSIEPKGIE